MSSSLLLQQCPACPVHLTLIVFVMGIKLPSSCCFVGCCLQDLFNIAHSILVYLPSSFFSIRFVSVHVVQPYSNYDRCLEKTAFHFISQVYLLYDDSLSTAVHTFASRVLTSVSVNETLLPRSVNLSLRATI